MASSPVIACAQTIVNKEKLFHPIRCQAINNRLLNGPLSVLQCTAADFAPFHVLSSSRVWREERRVCKQQSLFDDMIWAATRVKYNTAWQNNCEKQLLVYTMRSKNRAHFQIKLYSSNLISDESKHGKNALNEKFFARKQFKRPDFPQEIYLHFRKLS